MTTTDTGGPAFPSGEKYTVLDPYAKGGKSVLAKGPYHEGLTLLDWFAGQALHAFLNEFGFNDPTLAPTAAEYAYRLAEAMLAEKRQREVGDGD